MTALRDEDLEREIELVGALVLAAGESTERLPEAEIDELLGVERDVPEPPEQPQR